MNRLIQFRLASAIANSAAADPGKKEQTNTPVRSGGESGHGQETRTIFDALHTPEGGLQAIVCLVRAPE
jgi:hypothetical protein